MYNMHKNKVLKGKCAFLNFYPINKFFSVLLLYLSHHRESIFIRKIKPPQLFFLIIQERKH